ncbi:MAG: hypothetical protein CL624_00090 [Arcobacter sp.]|nr:hypothetical protein [Arcobacter sp.]|tara:strand:+ start:418 stop:684 length:267 start_codon:yes stop_codon:yes gene_type:complete
MFNACAMDNYNDAYPVHSYIDSFIQLHNRFKFTLVSKKIKVLYLIIQTSLDKFDNHSLLLIIWKKFYQFLKRNNKTSFIKILLDELNE